MVFIRNFISEACVRPECLLLVALPHRLYFCLSTSFVQATLIRNVRCSYSPSVTQSTFSIGSSRSSLNKLDSSNNESRVFRWTHYFCNLCRAIVIAYYYAECIDPQYERFSLFVLVLLIDPSGYTAVLSSHASYKDAKIIRHPSHLLPSQP